MGNSVTATLKSARWLITLIGLVLVAPALLALDLYLLVTGAFPVRLGAAAVFMAVLAAAWIRPGDLRWRQRRGSGE